MEGPPQKPATIVASITNPKHNIPTCDVLKPISVFKITTIILFCYCDPMLIQLSQAPCAQAKLNLTSFILHPITRLSPKQALQT